MEDLINSINNISLDDKKRNNYFKYQRMIPPQILKWIHDDIHKMYLQIINDSIQSVPCTFELFSNIHSLQLQEIKVLYDYISGYGVYILESNLKNCGLYYDKLDVNTYIDYYSEELYGYISLMEGC